MSSIENRDVKSLSELQALGGQKSDLTHDSKIYVTAKGLNKTLAEIIESGEIADGNRFGADIKNFAVAVADGSGEEYNTDVPYLNGSGHTQLDLHFEIKDLEVAQLYVGGEFYTKYISDDVTKNNWWRIVDLTTIEIKGDLTSEAVDLNFIVYRGSEIPVVPSVFAGLKVENEAFGFTDSPNGDGISNVTVADSKTVIEFDFNIKPNSIIFLYVDGELWPVQTPSNNTGKWYRKLSSNLIEIGQDLSGSHTPFYVAVFQGKSIIDEHGNMVVTLKPQIATFLLESPNGTKWQIGAGLSGELEIDSIVTDQIADRILFRRDDNTVVELFIEDSGQVSVDLPVNAGILFEAIYLSDVEGLVRTFGALNDNTPYTTPHGQNYSDLIRPNGNVIKRIQAMENNAVFESTGYVEVDDLPELINEPNQTLTTVIVKENDGSFSKKFWNTVRQRWENFLLNAMTPVGSSPIWWGKIDKVPENFEILEGQLKKVSDYPELFSRLGYQYGKDVTGDYFRLPNPVGRTIRALGTDNEFNKTVDPDFELRIKPSVGTTDYVGSIQEDELKSHNHTIQEGAGSGDGVRLDTFPDYQSTKSNIIGNTGGNETRMKNISAYLIMKVK